MPNASKGQWRLAAPIACAVYLDQIATGEIQEPASFPVGRIRQRTASAPTRAGRSVPLA